MNSFVFNQIDQETASAFAVDHSSDRPGGVIVATILTVNLRL